MDASQIALSHRSDQWLNETNLIVRRHPPNRIQPVQNTIVLDAGAKPTFGRTSNEG